MSFFINAMCITNKGNIRRNNEDNLYFDGRYLNEQHNELKYVQSIRRNSEDVCLFAVFDGIGGECFGEKASYLAARELDRKRQELTKVLQNPRQFLTDACMQMNRCICSKAEEFMAQGMGTTASILFFQADQFYVCNLGDSPIFRLHGGKLQKIYEEHTNRELLEEYGIKGRTPSLTQCLGISEDELRLEPYIAKGNLHSGDQFLIRSDGLTDMVSTEVISDIMQSAETQEECVNKLLLRALKNGGRDNITIMLCRIA